MDWEVV